MVIITRPLSVTFLLILCVCLLTNSCNGKKSIKEIRKIKRPDNVDDELYCASCYIIVSTCKERIKPTYKDAEILTVVSDSFNNHKKGFYSQYKHFKARALKDACELFVYAWDSYIEKYFSNEKNKNKDAIYELCYKKTAACENVWAQEEIEVRMKEAKSDL
jgi:hypothetical protein